MDADERLRGSGLGLAAALLFGLGAPLSKLLLPSARPLTLAALLYLGAGAAFLVARRRAAEARLTRADAPVCAGAVAVGAVSYGASLLLYLRAQRALGAARQSALFAVAPFAGAAAYIPLLGDRPAPADYAGAALMMLGVAALLRAKHAHVHTHEPMEHDHLHVHDVHHQHPHEGPRTEPHAHPHRHDALTHAHAHVSDAHHRHRHR